MKRTVTIVAVLSVMFTMICFGLYDLFPNKVLLAATITCGTTAYHFLMRLGVGFIFNKTMNNKADYTKKWYQCRSWEKKLYKKLRVKRWKSSMPTYEPSMFDYKKRSWDEIAQASCQAELVHEVIILLSFLPVFFSAWFDAVIVFIITSVLAALFDLIFVIIQRYNRPRIMRMIH